MVKTLMGRKLSMSGRFNRAGRQMPVTRLLVKPGTVTQIRRAASDGYWALCLGFGEKKLERSNKPQIGLIKKAGLKTTPRFFCEASVAPEDVPEVGTIIRVEDVFQPGDRVKVTGTSKGRGFAGVMKRWGFAGGPRTHGQSDRARAPGSIGASADPGRVWPGKKMAGRMGGRRVTIKNLVVQQVIPEENVLLLKGAVPGRSGSRLLITKVGEEKNFVPLRAEEGVEKTAGRKGE
jgi:large subunit ribosomal protein L3